MLSLLDGVSLSFALQFEHKRQNVLEIFSACLCEVIKAAKDTSFCNSLCE